MTSLPPEDDDALRWEGDDDAPIIRPQRVATPTIAAVDAAPVPASAAGLVFVGILAGVFFLETIGWIRGVLGDALASTIDTGSGTPIEIATFALNVGGRIAAVAAAPLWFGLIVLRVPAGVRRVGWLVVGAAVLVPWPVLVHVG